MGQCLAERNEAGVLGDAWIRRVKYHMHRIADHPFQGTPVGTVLDETLDDTGKMIRPKLLLLCAAYGPKLKENREKLCTLAAMVELTHLASLIHDDVVDEADFRRGKPSVQSKYGKDAAVYAGDFLMARIKYFEAVEHLNEASAVLAAAIERMCAGEIGQAVCRYRLDTTIPQYISNIRGKTVELFRAACRIGAMESGCSEDVTETLESIGETLGILFQIRDDYLDFTAGEAEMGKATHKDFRDGIYTMPVLYALQSSEESKDLLSLMEKNAKQTLSDRELSEAEALVVRLGGVEATRAEIGSCQQKIEALLKQLPQKEATRLMRDLVSRLTV